MNLFMEKENCLKIYLIFDIVYSYMLRMESTRTLHINQWFILVPFGPYRLFCKRISSPNTLSRSGFLLQSCVLYCLPPVNFWMKLFFLQMLQPPSPPVTTNAAPRLCWGQGLILSYFWLFQLNPSDFGWRNCENQNFNK